MLVTSVAWIGVLWCLFGSAGLFDCEDLLIIYDMFIYCCQRVIMNCADTYSLACCFGLMAPTVLLLSRVKWLVVRL